MDWTQSFDTNTDLFDSVTTLPPQDLADSLTKNDIIAFENLCPRNFIREDSNLVHMHIRWDKLCLSAQEIINVDDRLSPLFADLAKASFRIILCLLY